MASRLDHIFSYVNEIESRANKLTTSVSQSNELINTISFLNQATIEYDQTIDDITTLIEENNNSLNEFKSLHERAFYFDSNILHNDSITNQQAFEHITQEYMHLLGNLRKNDNYNYHDESKKGDEIVNTSQDDSNNLKRHHEPEIEHLDPPSPSQPQSQSQPLPQEELEQDLSPLRDHINPPDLKKMISVSNLRLKPMRCASSTSQLIAKKKSRYRLSSIYNINPIAYDESTIGTSSTSSSATEQSTTAELSTQEYDHSRMQNSVTNSYETLASHLLDPVQVNEGHELENGLLSKDNLHSIVTKEFDHIIPRGRSNSLPTSTTKDLSFSDDDILKEFDCEVDILRFNRLKHFISVSHLPNKHNYGDEVHIDEYDIDNDDEEDNNQDNGVFFNDIYHKSPTPQSRLSDHDDMVSVISDYSYYSPDKQQNHGSSENDDLFEYDNFSGFLRKSRLDLNKDLHQAFPHLMKPPTAEDTQSEMARLKYKFHNPIEKQLSSSQISTATFNVQASAVMQTKNLQRVTSLPYLPSNSKNSASSILHSYIERPSTPSETAHSSFSFNDSFLKFCQSKLGPTSMENPKLATPPRIKQLKKSKMIKSNPISIPSEAQLKRIPTQVQSLRNDGSYSKLTLGPNHTRLVKHGNGSLFKNPIIGSYDQFALKEALSSSLLD